jgi:hypothetical protein
MWTNHPGLVEGVDAFHRIVGPCGAGRTDHDTLGEIEEFITGVRVAA